MSILASVFEEVATEVVPDDSVILDQVTELVEVQEELGAATEQTVSLEIAEMLAGLAQQSGTFSSGNIATVESFYAQFGEGCTTESIKSAAKSFSDKSKEALKNIWAKFVEFFKKLIANANGQIAAFRRLDSKVKGLGTKLAWDSKSVTVDAYITVTKDGTGTEQFASNIGVVGAILTSVVKDNLAAGKWMVEKTEVNKQLQKAEDFWKSYKDLLDKAKNKDSVSIKKDDNTSNIAIVAPIQKLGAAMVYNLEVLQSYEATIKAVKIKDLNLKDQVDTASYLDPKVTVRRISRLISVNIIAMARTLNSVNKILKHVKADDGKE